MRRLTFGIVVALSLAASAAWQKAGSIQVADAQAFTKAVMKLGEISGNQMIGALAAGFLAEPPGSKFFGPMRPGSTALLPVFFDDSTIDKGFDGLGDSIEGALIYPMSIGKDEFLKLHPGAAETNGMLCVKGKIIDGDEDDDDDDDDDELIYVAFTPDGKWAVVSDKPEHVSLAMGCVKCAERPMDGALVRVCLAPQGMSAIRKIVDNIYTAWSEPDNVEARTEMSLAANWAGIAFAASGRMNSLRIFARSRYSRIVLPGSLPIQPRQIRFSIELSRLLSILSSFL